MTIAIANGFAIATSPKAADAWATADGQTGERRAPISAAVLPRLMARFPTAIKDYRH